MMVPTKITISEAEWEIMRVVWAHGQVTSREVIEILEEKMNWKESTIKTLLGRLVEKEALATSKEGRKFIYSALINEKETVEDYSHDILSRVCDKQNGKVIEKMIEEAALSQLDIELLIEQLRDKQLSAPEVVPCHCVPGQCECHLNH